MIATSEDELKKIDEKLLDENREKLVPLKALDLTNIKDIDELTQGMALTAFGGRQLGEAVDVTEAMIRDKNCLKVLTLSGAMTMAKMSLVICDMIDNGMVDVIISTGALMAHGFVEGAGMVHYKCPAKFRDINLRQNKLNRVYDTFEPEANLDSAQRIFKKILEQCDENKTLCSHEVNEKLGKYLNEHVPGRAILKSAYLKKVPIFIPAFTDSELGLDFALHNKRRMREGKKIIDFNPFLDLDEYEKIIFNAKKTGIFTIGGGVPRNWAQQIAPYLDLIRYRLINNSDKDKYFLKDIKNKAYDKPFTYGVRICPEPVHWGGLSGCTYSEGVSWGKFKSKQEGGRFAEVLCDATIAWPIIIKALLERLQKKPL